MEAPVHRATLSKKERLCGKKEISDLLAKGRFCSSGTFKYCYKRDNGQEYCRIIVSVGKKFFKRAVKRNLLKRRIRESYRTNKFILESCPGTDILFVYNTKDVLPYKEIETNIVNILNAVRNGK